MQDTDLHRELRTLILEAFANGEDIEGLWEISSVPDEIPDWDVSIQRTSDQLGDEIAETEPLNEQTV